MTEAALLERLAARLDIQSLLEAYAWTIDNGDWDGWIELFTPDGVFASGGTEYAGRAAVLEVAQRTYSRLAYLRRYLTIPGIRLEGDARAFARAGFQLVGATRSGKQVLGAGTYRFDLVRVADDWRIERCEARFDHYTKLQLPGGWGGAAADD